MTDQLIANEFDGVITYFDEFFGFTLGETNSSSGFSFGNEEVFFPTNLPFGPCLNETGPLFFETNVDVANNITNVLVFQTNIFCTWTTNEQIIPSAIDGEDYLSTDTTNIVFDDFQMSQDIYLNLPGGNFALGFFDNDFAGAAAGAAIPAALRR